MKKYFVFAAAALAALASCSKVEPEDLNGPELTFQVANYMNATKAVDGALFPTDATFSTYAWFTPASGTANQAFMTNQEISYQTNAWKATGKTYYWPKTGSIDFISYYPTSATPWLSISDNDTEKNAKITATISSALAGTEDYMYSDKAVGMTSNINEITDTEGSTRTDSNLSGVPTLFHHALAKVAVVVKTARLDDGKAENKTVFEVNLTSAKITKVSKTGTLEMTLASALTTGTTKVYGWNLPTNNVWTSTGEKADWAGVAIQPLTLEGNNTIAETTVLPQAVGTTTDGMALEIEYTVTTTPAGAPSTTENLKAKIFLSNNVDLTALTDAQKTGFTTITKMVNTAPDYWKMNTKTKYTVTIDPMTEEITFDPAVATWVTPEGVPVEEKDIK